MSLQELEGKTRLTTLLANVVASMQAVSPDKVCGASMHTNDEVHGDYNCPVRARFVNTLNEVRLYQVETPEFDSMVSALRDVCTALKSDDKAIQDTVWSTRTFGATLLEVCQGALDDVGMLEDENGT